MTANKSAREIQISDFIMSVMETLKFGKEAVKKSW